MHILAWLFSWLDGGILHVPGLTNEKVELHMVSG
jgi:hypothetical protein